LKTRGLAQAFGKVPREDFVGPGPWRVLRPAVEEGFVETPDANPVHLYDTVLVGLDIGTRLNNGEPVSVAQWLDLLELKEGDSFAHIGCGVGYYSGILGEVVGERGAGLALEIEPTVAEVASRGLAPYRHVTARCGGDLAPDEGPFDVIFVNAGATRVMPSWVGSLKQGGRLLIPLTVSFSGSQVGAGRVLRVTRVGNELDARFVSFAAIGHCEGGRTDAGNDALRVSYAEGDADQVAALRTDPHAQSDDCWLHAEDYCLSYRAVGD